MRDSKHKMSLFVTFGTLLIIGLLFFYWSQNNTNYSNKNEVEIVEVTIADGLRKEQTADILANALDWDTEQEIKFVVEDTARDILHAEGVLPGGTYQISTASSTYEVASLFLDRASERYRELGNGLSPEEWYEVLKVAAIAEHEANTPTELESVARSVWQNRYDYLRSDTTVQYVRDTLKMYPDKSCNGQEGVISGMVEYDSYVGNNGGEERTVCLHWRLAYTGADTDFDWWQPITEEDKAIAHGYNTYLYEGLPQHPIATPSVTAIEATLSVR